MLGNGDHYKKRIKEEGDNFRSVWFFVFFFLNIEVSMIKGSNTAMMSIILELTGPPSN